ncbi:uncharacterized protein LOC117815806 [Notolabrus celidotus]|uniref:uncharacterized protein LOC117815806 n=1 Tax=Notolabrus celidotus TaxID=1203425 RepID=UPI00149089FB|nr:uncharacterized protein LOC117815806 [Notolabrus celidotus]
MSCKQKSCVVNLFLVALTIYSYALQITYSVSLGQQEEDLWTYQEESTSTAWERTENHPQMHQRGWRLVEQTIKSPGLPKSNQPGINEILHEYATLPEDPVPRFSTNTPDGTDRNFVHNDSSWTTGNVKPQPRSSSTSSTDGYLADFTGFNGVQGKVIASPHFSKWQSTRPLVQCDDRVMTLKASGEGLSNLLVDREAASPISPFHLPPYCGYKVRTTWSDLEMTVPYDACYITQENGSYVLPLLWEGIPLKLSCPVQMSTPAPSSSHSAPAVFCSSYGMAVQILWHERDIPMMGVTVNEGWGPFVSDECAYLIQSNPGQLIFFISYSAPCITGGDGTHLQLILDDRGYILSCPVSPQLPHIPFPPPAAPGDPQSPYIPEPVTPAKTSPPPPPQPPTQEQFNQLPGYPHNPYPGYHYQELPQVYPPGPQPAPPPRPIPGSQPGPQPKSLKSILPSRTGKLPHSPGEIQEYHSLLQQATEIPNPGTVQDLSSFQVPQLPFNPNQYPSGGYYPYVPFHYPIVTAASAPPVETTSTTTTTTTPATQPPHQLPVNPYYPLYYPQIPYYPQVTQAPVTLPPSPPSPPPSPPKQPQGPPHPGRSLYPPASSRSYYHYKHYPHPKPGVEEASPPYPPIKAMVPQQPHSPSVVPLAKEKPQTLPHVPESPLATCPSYSHTICNYYYPYLYYPYIHALYPPYYHPPYPLEPQYPQTPPPMTTERPSTTTTAPTTTSSTTSTTTRSTPKTPHLQCQAGRMVVFLPFADPDSIQIREAQMKTWLFLPSVHPQCGYMLQVFEGSGVYLHSPLPACHSQPRTPTTNSLPLRFWDLSLAQYRTLDLQCPYQTIPETHAPATPSLSPKLPDTTKSKVQLSVVPKPKVFCYSHQMNVELPSGPISEIVVKDIKGNQMMLKDAPKQCGYSAGKGKDGKIHISLQLHSRCHMSVQDKMYIITVCYMTVNGRQETQFSCPVITPSSGQECNLPSEQRLPCGHGSVSRPQCLSMGCCFSRHSPACYYPMDECTIDRHFVFSVPASLTEPPLSPALLVAAGNSSCKPQRVTSDYALFKIPMDGCGTRRVMVGKTMIYMVDIVNKVQTISLNYGTITRDSPVRLLVECRYVPNTLLSVSYLVKTPTLGPDVQTQGMFGVQLRIAKDAMYSSYYPQYHQPLQMLLGKPLYLEVRLLNTPDPNLVLLVHFCVAYPRSGKAVWLLLYNGCPNTLDPDQQQAVLFDPPPPSHRAQTRRFTISTFQFLPDGEFKDQDEEIYFMCSTEICSPRDGPCVEGCFGQ